MTKQKATKSTGSTKVATPKVATTKDATLSARALNRATLARQHLLARTPMGVEAMIDHLVGMQAQQPRPPYVGLWTRLTTFSREDLHTAVHDKRVLRVTFVRGTLHLITAADYHRVRSTIQPLLSRGMQSIVRDRAATTDLDRVVAMAERFFGKRAANFETFREEVAAAFPDADVRALAYGARLNVPLVQVPDQSTWGWSPDPEFTSATRWTGRSVHAEGAPLTDLVRRYLAAFGPATPGDFGVWSAAPGAKALFAAIRDELVTFRDERGRELFDLPEAPRPDEDTPAPIRLLPDFDNLVLAHDDRTRLMDDAHRAKILTKNLLVRATVLVDGRVAGMWKVERKAKVATFALTPFVKLTKQTLAEIEAEADALLRFVEPDAPTRAMRVDKD